MVERGVFRFPAGASRREEGGLHRAGLPGSYNPRNPSNPWSAPRSDSPGLSLIGSRLWRGDMRVSTRLIGLRFVLPPRRVFFNILKSRHLQIWVRFVKTRFHFQAGTGPNHPFSRGKTMVFGFGRVHHLASFRKKQQPRYSVTRLLSRSLFCKLHFHKQ